MFRLFVLCLAILSSICAIQCAPTMVRRAQPSPTPGVLVARGLCYFHCPQENLVGKGLSTSYADPGRLYCRYDVEESDDKEFCMYNRNTGELLSSSSPSQCDDQAVFDCPGTKNGQQEMKRVPAQPKGARTVNLPEYVKARSMARRAMEVDTV